MRRLNDLLRRWWRSLDRKYLRPGYEPNLPDQINIETASICNLRCACCPHGVARSAMRPSGMMSVETFQRVLSHLDIPLKHAYLHLHGEPFLNPNLALFVEELTRRQVTVNLYSNGVAVDEAQLDAILQLQHVTVNFSADLLGQEYYEGIRVGAHYADALNKLDAINALFARRNKYFNLVIIVDSSLAERTSASAARGADAIYESCQSLYTRYSRLNGILLGSKFPWPRLPWTGDLTGHLGRERHRCSHAFEGLSILWNGVASMCSFDYTGECVVGSLLEHTYTEVFNSPAARRFRALHWRHRDSELPLCNDCVLDRYVPSSVKLHRAGFLKQDKNETTQIIQSFFRL